MKRLTTLLLSTLLSILSSPESIHSSSSPTNSTNANTESTNQSIRNQSTGVKPSYTAIEDGVIPNKTYTEKLKASNFCYWNLSVPSSSTTQKKTSSSLDTVYLSDTQFEQFQAACSTKKPGSTQVTKPNRSTSLLPATTIAQAFATNLRDGAFAVNLQTNKSNHFHTKFNINTNQIDLTLVDIIAGKSSSSNITLEDLEYLPFHYLNTITSYVGRVALAAQTLEPVFKGSDGKGITDTYNGQSINNYTQVYQPFINKAQWFLPRLTYSLATLGNPISNDLTPYKIALSQPANSPNNSQNAPLPSSTTNGTGGSQNGPPPMDGSTQNEAPYVSSQSANLNSNLINNTNFSPDSIIGPHSTLSYLDMFLGVYLVNSVTCEQPSTSETYETLLVFQSKDSQNKTHIYPGEGGVLPTSGPADKWTSVINGGTFVAGRNVNFDFTLSAINTSTNSVIQGTSSQESYSIAINSNQLSRVSIYNTPNANASPLGIYDLSNFIKYPTPWAILIDVGGTATIENGNTSLTPSITPNVIGLVKVNPYYYPLQLEGFFNGNTVSYDSSNIYTYKDMFNAPSKLYELCFPTYQNIPYFPTSGDNQFQGDARAFCCGYQNNSSTAAAYPAGYLLLQGVCNGYLQFSNPKFTNPVIQNLTSQNSQTQSVALGTIPNTLTMTQWFDPTCMNLDYLFLRLLTTMRYMLQQLYFTPNCGILYNAIAEKNFEENIYYFMWNDKPWPIAESSVKEYSGYNPQLAFLANNEKSGYQVVNTKNLIAPPPTAKPPVSPSPSASTETGSANSYS